MSSDPEIFQDFAQSLAARDPKTVRAYLSALRGFAQWLAAQPGGDPFSPEVITETAVRGYLNYLKDKKRAPSTRSQALTAMRRFCRWAIGKEYMTRNPDLLTGAAPTGYRQAVLIAALMASGMNIGPTKPSSR